MGVPRSFRPEWLRIREDGRGRRNVYDKSVERTLRETGSSHQECHTRVLVVVVGVDL